MKYFSDKVAKGKVFCNRDQERAELINAIDSNEHCIVVAPRRYGKTSLVMQSIREADVSFAMIDLFCVVYEEDVTRKIAKGVSTIAQQLMGRTEKTLSFLETVFKAATIGLRAGSFEVSVDFSKRISSTEQIEDLLLGLEQIACKVKKKAVFFIDEFQDILKIENSSKIQAAIRSVAQHSEYITYIFSGSSRHMLEKIFEDSNQPLFMMCHKMLIDRIQPEHFEKHIQKAFRARWKLKTPQEVIDEILKLTESHTYYVNALCAVLSKNEAMPTVKVVKDTWHGLLSKYKGKLIVELEKLNTNRLKVLTTVALMGRVSSPNSREFIERVKLPLSSTQVAVDYLLKYDYLYSTANHDLKLVDPLMAAFLVDRF